MKILNKKIILVVIVVAEILLGLYFINQYQQQKVLGTSIVTKLDKTKIIIDQNEDLKYYLKLGPGEWDEQPEWLPYNVTYRINNDGLRDIYNYEIEKPADTYRIVTLGDSLTYGHHVNGKDNWTEQLEVMLNENISNCEYKNFEVINLGMPGFDVQYIVQRYKELGQKYNPDLILWFESGYGFSRHTELTEPIVEKCYEESSPSDLANDEKNYYKYARCRSVAYEQIHEEYSPLELIQSIEHDYDIFFNLFGTENTIIFYYQYLPKKHEKIRDDWIKKYNNTTFIPLIPNQTEEEKLPDSHPNKLGHQTIATHIFEYLKNKEIKCL